ncbi:SH3 domain-containing protein [Streptomyces sp. NPDC001668]|uniref:SH3 domain-containing protein n=1 Tax=Streptomyces sp. NPDC001668 TaxID=3364598 RepID=UPI0036A9EA1B
MPISIGRMAAVGALGASLIGSAVAMAPAAQAYDTGTTKISCSAVKVRTSPSQSGTVVGVAYRGDKMTYNQWVYKKSEKRWYTRGVVKRKSDGAKIRGYVVYRCANPYESNGAPTPPIPK